MMFQAFNLHLDIYIYRSLVRGFRSLVRGFSSSPHSISSCRTSKIPFLSPGSRTQWRPIQVNHREGEPRRYELMEIQWGDHGNISPHWWTFTIWLWLTVCHGKSPFLKGTPSINGPFPMAMSVITRGYIFRISGEYDGNMNRIFNFASMDWFKEHQQT